MRATWLDPKNGVFVGGDGKVRQKATRPGYNIVPGRIYIDGRLVMSTNEPFKQWARRVEHQRHR